MNYALTYGEQLELALLLDGARPDYDTIECRVLINLGYAKRIASGMMEITTAGVDELGRLAAARGESDDLFNGNHGF